MSGAHIWHGPSPLKTESIGISYVLIGAVCSENIEHKVKRFTFVVMGEKQLTWKFHFFPLFKN